ncbi:hypothetical protein HUA76_28035 [Myxococcus sp. CA056]|uniref:hypothetical protein n=1 Tax=Myxococcus sp. CA056 TaxID=2741740 RepID=UPI00157A86F1|nr:hypothetical protein [Myxococcus sp. CA056]NTX14651.1 hypothetical protein [Myxococcus sp. CA056]
MKLAAVSPLLAVLLLGAVLPREVLAQQEDVQAPTTQGESVQAPPLIAAPDNVEPAPFVPPRSPGAEAPLPPVKAGMPAVPRVIIEATAGGLGMVAGGLLAFSGGALTGNCSLLEDDCVLPIIAGFTGMALGAAMGTYAAGSVMKGRGSLVATLVGGLAGTGAGVLGFFARDGADLFGIITIFALPPIGAMLGYELSRSEPPAVSRFSQTRNQGAPLPAFTFRVTPHGGLMGGVAGRF